MKPAKRVTIQEAQQDLTHFLESARKGEEIILLDAGRPVAKLVPFEAQVEAVENDALIEEQDSVLDDREPGVAPLLPKNAHFFFED